MLADPFAVSGGIRKFTWYPSTAPGKPTALRTSAAFPLTFTSTGELTAAKGLDGKGTLAQDRLRAPSAVGPSPVANRDKTSLAAAGLDAVTREKSLEWVTAKPLEVVKICGADIGIKCSTYCCATSASIEAAAGSRGPLLWRLLVGLPLPAGLPLPPSGPEHREMLPYRPLLP